MQGKRRLCESNTRFFFIECMYCADKIVTWEGIKIVINYLTLTADASEAQRVCILV